MFGDFLKYFSNPIAPIEGYLIAALSVIIYVLLLLRVKCYEQSANGPTNSLLTFFFYYYVFQYVSINWVSCNLDKFQLVVAGGCVEVIKSGINHALF